MLSKSWRNIRVRTATEGYRAGRVRSAPRTSSCCCINTETRATRATRSPGRARRSSSLARSISGARLPRGERSEGVSEGCGAASDDASGRGVVVAIRQRTIPSAEKRSGGTRNVSRDVRGLGASRRTPRVGEGEVDWSDFAAFVLGTDMPRRHDERDEGAAAAAEAEAEVVGASRPRRYEVVPGGGVAETWPGGFARLEYLPSPIHRLAALPRGKRSGDVVVLIAPDHPPRIAATLRHHTAYKPHSVFDAAHVDDTPVLVVASSGDDQHFLSLWRIPYNAPSSKTAGPLTPALIHRKEAKEPQSSVVYSKRADRLYSAGLASGFVSARRRNPSRLVVGRRGVEARFRPTRRRASKPVSGRLVVVPPKHRSIERTPSARPAGVVVVS